MVINVAEVGQKLSGGLLKVKSRNIRADDTEDTSQLHKLTHNQIHKTKQYECQVVSKRC